MEGSLLWVLACTLATEEKTFTKRTAYQKSLPKNKILKISYWSFPENGILYSLNQFLEIKFGSGTHHGKIDSLCKNKALYEQL